MAWKDFHRRKNTAVWWDEKNKYYRCNISNRRGKKVRYKLVRLGRYD